ncbi:hypothetical protein DLREEDagrD3_02900 [Denitratisoma sp. agr-D3]
MKVATRIFLGALVATMAIPTLAQVTSVNGDPNSWRSNDLPDEGPWTEKTVALPPFPKEADLLEFYVAAVASNRFFIDKTSIAPSEDGVVRYTLVIQTSGGATNVTYEGIRCDTGEVKVYGLGRNDGTWAQSRNPQWKPIENKPINRHHAALRAEYFCTQGMIRDQAEGIAVLKRGPQR